MIGSIETRNKGDRLSLKRFIELNVIETKGVLCDRNDGK